MTSQLNVDTIVDKAGSGGSNVKMANTSTYVSEGGAKTANNVVQGLTKAWANITQSSSHTANDSFNVGSLTDNGAGDTSLNFTNSMANANFCAASGHMNLGTKIQFHDSDASSSVKVRNRDMDASGNEDADEIATQVAGDLA